MLEYRHHTIYLRHQDVYKRQVRCVAGEPDIVIIGRRTGFTGDGHTAEVDSSTGTGGDNILHCAR